MPGSASKIFTAITLMTTLLLSACDEQTDILRKTGYGPVIGSKVGSLMVFLGIPYAAPPVDELRWAPPQPHEGWIVPRLAKNFASACVQGGAPTGAIGSEEDCLYLNVWAPLKPGPHPVMVWLHGGAFMIGSANELPYDGAKLAAEHDVVVVSINYRLSYLGFLTLPQLDGQPAHQINGNQGLLDQVWALQWVQNHVDKYGGDPDNVTLFGESAGAISSCLLLASPLTDGLIDKAIMQSGVCSTFTIKTRAQAEAQGLQFLEAIGCDSAADAVACAGQLGQNSFKHLLGIKDNEIFTADPDDWGFVGGPSIDGNVLPDAVDTLLAQSPKQSTVPLLLGSNADEGTLFIGMRELPGDDSSYLDYLSQHFPGLETPLSQLYPLNTFNPSGAAAAQIFTDSLMTCPAQHLASRWSSSQDVFLYHFSRSVDPGPLGFFQLLFSANAAPLGTYHGAEVPYVFGFDSVLGELTSFAMQETSRQLQRYWANFARTGNPNGSGLVAWPPYTDNQPGTLNIGNTTAVQTALRGRYCDFWQQHSVEF